MIVEWNRLRGRTPMFAPSFRTFKSSLLMSSQSSSSSSQSSSSSSSMLPLRCSSSSSSSFIRSNVDEEINSLYMKQLSQVSSAANVQDQSFDLHRFICEILSAMSAVAAAAADEKKKKVEQEQQQQNFCSTATVEEAVHRIINHFRSMISSSSSHHSDSDACADIKACEELLTKRISMMKRRSVDI